VAAPVAGAPSGRMLGTHRKRCTISILVKILALPVRDLPSLMNLEPSHGFLVKSKWRQKWARAFFFHLIVNKYTFCPMVFPPKPQRTTNQSRPSLLPRSYVYTIALFAARFNQSYV